MSRVLPGMVAALAILTAAVDVRARGDADVHVHAHKRFEAGADARRDVCTAAGQRLSFISERLRADARDGRIWRLGWGLGFAALAVGQAGLALTRDDAGERAELYVGAAKSALGLVPVLLVPVSAIEDAAVLEGRMATGPSGDARCALLPTAEDLLRRSAADEAFARGWLAHALTVAVNGGGLLIIGFGYDRWTTAVAGALIGTAVGEVQIFTRPTAALRAARGAARWSVAPIIAPQTIGLHVSARY